jgi:hypothetical protein
MAVADAVGMDMRPRRVAGPLRLGMVVRVLDGLEARVKVDVPRHA